MKIQFAVMAVFISVLILFGSPPVEAQIGILDECEALDDEEDQSWCFVTQAEKTKSLKPCGRLKMWQSMSQCIDYVAKVRTLKESDCDELSKYSNTCREKLGFELAAIWDKHSEKKLEPCSAALKNASVPSQTEFSAYDAENSRVKGPASQMRRDIFVRLRALRRSLVQAAQNSALPPQERRGHASTQYADIMQLCEAAAQQAKLPDLARAIEAQGTRF